MLLGEFADGALLFRSASFLAIFTRGFGFLF